MSKFAEGVGIGVLIVVSLMYLMFVVLVSFLVAGFGGNPWQGVLAFAILGSPVIAVSITALSHNKEKQIQRGNPLLVSAQPRIQMKLQAGAWAWVLLIFLVLIFLSPNIMGIWFRG